MAFALVEPGKLGTTASTSVVLTPTTACAVNELCIISVAIADVTKTASITDSTSGSNTWTVHPDCPVNNSGNTIRLYVFWSLIQASTTSVTVTLSGAANCTSTLEHFTGNALTSLVGVHTTATNTGTSAAVTNPTPTAGNMMFVAVAEPVASTHTAGSNYTIGQNNTIMGDEYRLICTATETCPMTLGTSVNWVEAVIEFAVGAVTTTTVNLDAVNLYKSPWNHFTSGSGGSATDLMLTSGAYYRLKFTGAASLSMTVDVTPLTGASTSAANYPFLAYRISDNSKTYVGAWSTRQFTSADAAVTLFSGLTPANTYEAWIVQTSISNSIDRWTTPLAGIKVTTFTLSSAVGGGAPSTSTPTTRSGTMLVLGESITEGIGTGSATDARTSHAWHLAAELDCEIGMIAYGNTGLTGVVTGSLTNVVGQSTSWPLYYNGQSRLSGGLLSPAPTYFCMFGGAGDAILASPPSSGSLQTSYQTFITAVIAALGASSKLILCVPFSGSYRTAVTAAKAAVGDSRTYLIDLTAAVDVFFDTAGQNATEWTTDGRHPSSSYQGQLAAREADAIRTAITPASTGGGGRRRSGVSF